MMPVDDGNHRVVVTESIVDQLAQQYGTLWGRPPDQQELTGLVDGYVREEILYREGVSLGLTKDDVVIKRRVRQKLEVISEEQGAQGAPSDAQLADYLAKHPEHFLRPQITSFDQVVFDSTGDRATLMKSFESARAALSAGADPATLGVPSMLPHHVKAMPMPGVAHDFGDAFAANIARLPVGTWEGPIVSGFGVHLVRITGRIQGSAPPLAGVRSDVAREWENERRKRALDENYAALRKNYEVVIEAKGAPQAVSNR